MKVTPNQGTLGAKVEDIDLAKPLDRADFGRILHALGAHGVLCFPNQTLDALTLKAFSERFGSLQLSPTGTYCEPGVPEVMLLSNDGEDGKNIGLADAGQDWHTDMSYNAVIGFLNVLWAIKVPRRNGKPLGNTVFADMHAAYDDLSPALKSRLAAAVGASGVPHPSDHRAQGALRQSGLHHPHQRAARARKRRGAGRAVRAPASAEVPARPCLDRGRRADVVPHQHAAQRDSGLHQIGRAHV